MIGCFGGVSASGDLVFDIWLCDRGEDLARGSESVRMCCKLCFESDVPLTPSLPVLVCGSDSGAMGASLLSIVLEIGDMIAPGMFARVWCQLGH